MYLIDLNNRHYVTQMTYQIEEDLNGNKVFSAVIKPTKPNLVFLENLEKMWTLVDDDENFYKVAFVKKQGEGKLLSAEIRAIPSFYDDFDNDRVYEEYNRSLTAKVAFDIIFAGSGYFYQMSGDYYAIDWEGFGGGSTRLEMFQDALNRYGAEFTVMGQTVFIKKLIGEDLNVMYRHRLNASNIVQETDATSFWTYAKGYGDYEGDKEAGDWKDAKLIREYTSPIANIPGIGKRHAPPIKDGRVKIASVMDANLKRLVDESLKISVTADIHDLTKQKYPIAQTNVGDRVFLIDERILLNEEVRVVNKSVVRDWRGNILDIRLTFGSQDIVKRHQASLSNAAKTVNELFNGRKKLPLNALASEVANVTKAILSAQTELDFTNGIIARDPYNPNLVVMLTSAGLGVSQDGGKTFRNAITGRGILAEHILAGTITAGGNKRIDISDGSIWSYFGNKLTMNFGQYSLDFYHTDESLIGSFGRGTIPMSNGSTYARGLNLLVANSFFDIIHLRNDVRNFAFRTAAFNIDNNYTAVAGPQAWAGKSFLGLYTDAELWKNNRRTDQACMVFEQTPTEHNTHLFFGGRSETGARKAGTFGVIYNDSEDTSQLIAQAQKDRWWVRQLQAGEKAYVSSTSNSARFGVSDNTYITINDNGYVFFVVNGVVKHTFSPD